MSWPPIPVIPTFKKREWSFVQQSTNFPLEHIPILNLLSHSDPLGLLVDLFSAVSCPNHSNSFLVILLLSLLIPILDLNGLDSSAQTALLIGSLEALCSLQEVLGDVVVVIEVGEI